MESAKLHIWSQVEQDQGQGEIPVSREVFHYS